MQYIKRIDYSLLFIFNKDLIDQIIRAVPKFLILFKDALDSTEDIKQFVKYYMSEKYGKNWLNKVDQKLFCQEFVEYFNYWSLIFKKLGIRTYLIDWFNNEFRAIDDILDLLPDSYPNKAEAVLVSQVKMTSFKLMSKDSAVLISEATLNVLTKSQLNKCTLEICEPDAMLTNMRQTIREKLIIELYFMKLLYNYIRIKHPYLASLKDKYKIPYLGPLEKDLSKGNLLINFLNVLDIYIFINGRYG